jgi:hypothetical protein
VGWAVDGGVVAPEADADVLLANLFTRVSVVKVA